MLAKMKLIFEKKILVYGPFIARKVGEDTLFCKHQQRSNTPHHHLRRHRRSPPRLDPSSPSHQRHDAQRRRRPGAGPRLPARGVLLALPRGKGQDRPQGRPVPCMPRDRPPRHHRRLRAHPLRTAARAPACAPARLPARLPACAPACLRACLPGLPAHRTRNTVLPAMQIKYLEAKDDEEPNWRVTPPAATALARAGADRWAERNQPRRRAGSGWGWRQTRTRRWPRPRCSSACSRPTRRLPRWYARPRALPPMRRRREPRARRQGAPAS